MGEGQRIRFPPFLPHQLEVKRNFAPHSVLCWGAQAGKTWFSLAFQAAFVLSRPGNHAWIDRDGKFARDAFRRARALVPRDEVVECSRVDLFYRLRSGAEWWFFSGVEPDAFRGKRRASAVFNEASYIPEEAFTEVIGPRLAGWALFNFTPKGRANWTFRNLWLQADGRSAAWRRWHHSSYDNRTNDRARLEESRHWLPEAQYRQEILAEFVSDYGQFFNPSPRFWAGAFEPYQKGGRYVAGIDWAKHNDFSAYVIVRVDCLPRRVVDFGRLPHMDYTAQIPVIAARLRAYGNPPGYADKSEETANELLRLQGLNVHDFAFTAQSKPFAADQLRVAMERGELVAPASREKVEALRADGHVGVAFGDPGAQTEEQRKACRWLEDEVAFFEPYVVGSRVKLGARGIHNDDILAAMMEANLAAQKFGASDSLVIGRIGGARPWR